MTETQPPKSRRNFALVGLFLLLVAFPAMSWYYLQKGFNYSKKVFQETAAKGHLDSFDIDVLPVGLYADSLDGKALLLVDDTRLANRENLQRVRKQFNNNPNLVTIYHQGQAGAFDMSISGDYGYDMRAPYDYTTLDSENDILLIDKDGMVRYAYKSSENIWKSMVQHLAFVVPKESKDRLSIKRK